MRPDPVCVSNRQGVQEDALESYPIRHNGTGHLFFSTVAEYAYDGAKRRILKNKYSSGVLSETRHSYYSDDWQVLEEQVDSSSDAEMQFVWGLRFVDDLILRHRDTSDPKNGSLDERIYAL